MYLASAMSWRRRALPAEWLDGLPRQAAAREELDEVVTSFLERPLDAGPYRYLWLEALTQRVREEGRIQQVTVVVATAVNADGKREMLGVYVGTSEDGAFWLAFPRGLVARGLSGSSWSPPMPTGDCARLSAPSSQAPPGNVAGHTS